MLSYYEQELSETQAGFRKDNRTRDQIMNMRLICEKQIEHSKNVYCCFIDYSKAFDCVDFELMWRTLIMRHSLEKCEYGIEIGGKLYNNLRYADDLALLATTEGNLQQMVNDVGKASERFGLSLNAKKTQVVVIGRHISTINILYNGAPLEHVKQLIYLGASFNEKGDTIKDVKRRVAIAKRASGDLHRIWRNRELPIPLKRKLVQLMIWPIMSYGSETWIYLKSVQNDGAIEECCASHGWNMSPTRRCLTGPTQSPPSLMDFLRDDWLSMVT